MLDGSRHVSQQHLDTSQSWQPTRFIRFERGLETSMRTAIIQTDAGRAYIKAMGNPEGLHALACEWVGTELARWIGLPTLEYAIMNVEPDDEIPFPDGGGAQPGPAFVTRAVRGQVWDGSPEMLQLLDNPDDLTVLVVFDTWTRNRDRYDPPLPLASDVPTDGEQAAGAAMLHRPHKPHYDNVFLSEQGATPGRFRLLAMDHTHCFTYGRPLNHRLADIDPVRDECLYGYFPEFTPWIKLEVAERAARRMREMDRSTADAMVRGIPQQWDVSVPARAAMVEFICGRAAFLADNVVNLLKQHDGLLPF
jgi:hypothetical protein